jgi:hypothetical protein
MLAQHTAGFRGEKCLAAAGFPRAGFISFARIIMQRLSWLFRLKSRLPIKVSGAGAREANDIARRLLCARCGCCLNQARQPIDGPSPPAPCHGAAALESQQESGWQVQLATPSDRVGPFAGVHLICGPWGGPGDRYTCPHAVILYKAAI